MGISRVSFKSLVNKLPWGGGRAEKADQGGVSKGQKRCKKWRVCFKGNKTNTCPDLIGTERGGGVELYD